MKRFRFEHSYPLSSCYTEPDIRYIARRSKTLTFSEKKFDEESHWMGVVKHGWRPSDMHAIAIIQRFYDKPGCADPFRSFGFSDGTALGAINWRPFFAYAGSTVYFTIRAFFAGRGGDGRQQAASACCDQRCLVCGHNIEANTDGVVAVFDDVLRMEAFCLACSADVLGVSHENWRRFVLLSDNRFPGFLKSFCKRKLIYDRRNGE